MDQNEYAPLQQLHQAEREPYAANGDGIHIALQDDVRSLAFSDLPKKTELKRDLEEHHVNMIAFSACIGVGLFLQSGRVTYLAGPGLAWIAYLVCGSFVWATMGCLGEMTALFPQSGGIFWFPANFLDEGTGYALGWLVWFSWVVIIASEILAVSQLWNFHFSPAYLSEVGYPQPGYPNPELQWQVGEDYNPAVWVTLFLSIVFLVNCLPVLLYGQLEYLFGCIKMVFIVFLIFFNIVINALKRVPHPQQGNSRFWTYDSPWSFAAQNTTLRQGTDGNADLVVTGGAGTFLGMWSGMTTVIFSIIGFEAVSITAGENKALFAPETMKIATRKISMRVIFLYAFACFAVGLNVPYTDENLRDFTNNSIKSGEHSIFIIATVRNRLTGWPNFFNAFFIFSATTSGINSLYISSRILHSLAHVESVWPNFPFIDKFRRNLQRTIWGVPYAAVFVSWLFGTLAYLSTAPTPAIELGRLATNSVVSMLIVYSFLCITFLRFHQRINQAARANDVNNMAHLGKYDRERRRYPYKSHFQRGRALWGLLGCSLLAVFNGWRSFVNPFEPRDFVASYITFFVFIVLWILYHMKLQGWNPMGWRLSPLNQLQDPPPMEVVDFPRKGELKLSVSADNPWYSRTNLVIIRKWLWTWIR